MLCDRWKIPNERILSMVLEREGLLLWAAFFELEAENREGMMSPEDWFETMPYG